MLFNNPLYPERESFIIANSSFKPVEDWTDAGINYVDLNTGITYVGGLNDLKLITPSNKSDSFSKNCLIYMVLRELGYLTTPKLRVNKVSTSVIAG